MPADSALTPAPPQSGWHLREWACELLGTALLLLGGLSAVVLDFGPESPLSGWSRSPKLLVTGLMFAGCGSLVTISRIGRRSGAHLNPAVTLAFWSQGKVHIHDVMGYIAGQLVGAVTGTAVVLVVWRHDARAVGLGATAPGVGVSDLQAVLIEAGMTTILVLSILLMTSSPRTARWTPLLLWFLIAALVWQGAPYTGTSLNPARSFGPALLDPMWHTYLIYVAGPLLGALAAVGLFALLPDVQVVTAKLFHDSRYPSTMASSLPVAPR